MSSINNGIPFVPEGTTDPAAGLNLSINTIDALLQAAVISITSTLPGSPAEGDRYALEDGTIARYLDSAWSYYPAHVVMSIATLQWYHWDGAEWQAVGGGGGGMVESVTGDGVDNTDPANPVLRFGPWPGRVDSGSSVTLTSADLGRLVETTAATPTVAIPEAEPDGFVCYGIHHGAGTLEFSHSSGVDLLHPSGVTPSVPPGSPWTLIKSRTAADTWYVFGGLEATS